MPPTPLPRTRVICTQGPFCLTMLPSLISGLQVFRGRGRQEGLIWEIFASQDQKWYVSSPPTFHWPEFSHRDHLTARGWDMGCSPVARKEKTRWARVSAGSGLRNCGYALMPVFRKASGGKPNSVSCPALRNVTFFSDLGEDIEGALLLFCMQPLQVTLCKGSSPGVSGKREPRGQISR